MMATESERAEMISLVVTWLYRRGVEWGEASVTAAQQGNGDSAVDRRARSSEAMDAARELELAARRASTVAEFSAYLNRSAPPSSADVDAAVLRLIRDIDLSKRYGNLVPLPDLRAETRRLGLLDEDVTASLLALEQDYVIDLLIASAPTRVADRAAGIERPGRGLLYYVTVR